MNASHHYIFTMVPDTISRNLKLMLLLQGRRLLRQLKSFITSKHTLFINNIYYN